MPSPPPRSGQNPRRPLGIKARGSSPPAMTKQHRTAGTSPANRGSKDAYVPTPADTKNRREQMNPNNPKYASSRGGG